MGKMESAETGPMSFFKMLGIAAETFVGVKAVQTRALMF